MYTYKHLISVLIGAVICLASTLTAQTCTLTLKGRVADEDNHEGLGFSVLHLQPGDHIVQTNATGEFEIGSLCAGSYTLRVQHVGCRDSVLVLQLNRPKKITVKLPHNLNALNDVEILAKHEDLRQTQAVSVLDAKALETTSGQSLGEQLKQLNGITTFNTGPGISRPMINGMQGYRILILNNGVRQEGQQWGNEHAPEIDPFIADRITLVRGAASVRYGSDAIGGVIMVDPADLPDSAGVTGQLRMSGQSNGRGGAAALQIQGGSTRIRHFSWRVQASARKLGNIRTPDYFLRNTGTEEQNFSYQLGYHRKKFGVSFYYSQFNTKLGIFTGAHTGNLTDLYNAFNLKKPADSLAGFSYEIGRPFQNVEHELARVSIDIHTGTRSRILLNYARQYNLRQEYDRHVPRRGDEPELDYRITTHTSELYWEHDYIRSFRGRIGVQGMQQENIYLGRFFIPNYRNRTAGVFAFERFVRSRFELEAGLRYDIKELQSYFYKGSELQNPNLLFRNFSYNAGTIIKPGDAWRLSMNAGTGWRAPAVNELYSDGLHHGAGAIERGNDRLQTEYCLSGVITSNYLSKYFEADITAYHYEFENFIYFLPAPQPELTIRGAFPVFNYTQHNAAISGADIDGRIKVHERIQVRLRSMWIRGYNRELNTHLIYMPADRYQASVRFNLKDSRKLKDLFLEPGMLYVERQDRIPPASDFAAPPGAYLLFGFTGGVTINAGHVPLYLTLTVNNIANTVYRDYLDRFRYFNDASGSNYMLNLKIPFTVYNKKANT